jgi:hypothetical protein
MTARRGVQRRLPRAVAMFLPPVLALLAAAAYTEWKMRGAERDAARLCSLVTPGMPLQQFVDTAIDGGFEVTGLNPASRTATASKVVYRLDAEVFRCRAEHDGTRIISTATSHARE